jgi:hypothetical protein
MTTTDWLLDIALILLVIRQIREAKMDLRFFLIPLGIVGYTASKYLHALPTAGNDLVLIAGCFTVGALLGVAGGLTTHVRAADGVAYARAGVSAAAIWIVSMTARLAFIIYITHSAGEAWLTRFSIAHNLTSADVWQTALVILALTEVIVRIGIIGARGAHQKAAAAQATPAKTLLTV